MIKRVDLFYRDNKLVIVGPAAELLELITYLLDNPSVTGKVKRAFYKVFERIGDED